MTEPVAIAAIRARHDAMVGASYSVALDIRLNHAHTDIAVLLAEVERLREDSDLIEEQRNSALAQLETVRDWEVENDALRARVAQLEAELRDHEAFFREGADDQETPVADLRAGLALYVEQLEAELREAQT